MKHKKMNLNIIELPQIDFSINLNDIYIHRLRKKNKKNTSEYLGLCGITGTIVGEGAGTALGVLITVVAGEFTIVPAVVMSVSMGVLCSLTGDTVEQALYPTC
mgnify:CR=1 FL=1